LGPVSQATHPFYIAVTEVNHNANEKTLEISCKMFAEDIEEQLEKNYKATLDIRAEKDKASFDKFIPDYINRNFGIWLDGKPAALQFLGFETDGESTYIYFEVPKISHPKNVRISNSILYDFQQGQINIVHVTVNGKRQSSKLTYPHKEVNFGF
jgi:hypothetical protein